MDALQQGTVSGERWDRKGPSRVAVERLKPQWGTGMACGRRNSSTISEIVGNWYNYKDNGTGWPLLETIDSPEEKILNSCERLNSTERLS